MPETGPKQRPSWPDAVAPVEAEVEQLTPDQMLDRVLDTVYTDSNELVQAMAFVGGELPRLGLSHLVPFNTAYLSLSCDVRDTVKKGAAVAGADDFDSKFQYPETVEKTMGIFAELYFKQVRAHLNGKSHLVDDAWQPLFYGAAGRNASPGIQFLLGMNAHIVYDLPQALAKSGVTESYYRDYTKTVGLLINEVAEYLGPAYVPGTDRMRGYLIGKTVDRIAVWREEAWQAAQSLMGNIQAADEVADTAKLLPARSVPWEATSHRLSARDVMRERRKAALRNARLIGLAGRLALVGVSSVGGRPPVQVAEITELAIRRAAEVVERQAA